MNTKKFFTIPMSLLFFINLLWGQMENIRFNHITTNNGLASNAVYSVCKDSSGYMWFGGEGGLDRFDGYEIRHYKPDVLNPGAFKGTIAAAIYKDHKNRIWVGSGDAGISLYIRKKDAFKSYTEIFSASGEQVISKRLGDRLYEDATGRLWEIGSELAYFDENKDRFIQFNNNDLYPDARCLFSDSEGTFWVGGNHSNISFIDPKTLKVQNIIITPKVASNFPNIGIWRILEDKKHRFWLLTERHGLLLCDKTNGVVVKQFCEENSLLNCNYIIDGLVNTDGKLWLLTSVGGLNIFDPETESFSYLKHDPLDSYSLSTNALQTI